MGVGWLAIKIHPGSVNPISLGPIVPVDNPSPISPITGKSDDEYNKETWPDEQIQQELGYTQGTLTTFCFKHGIFASISRLESNHPIG